MGLPSSGQHMARQIGLVLREICEDEVARGRPMLSAVAVGVSGEPGLGFYAAAKGLGRTVTDARDKAFWERERDAVYETWERPIH